MTDTTVKKKVLGKATQKETNQKSGSTDIRLQHEALDPSTVGIDCIPDQGDRGRVMVFINGTNLFYAASQLSIEIDYVKLLNYLTASDYLVHAFFYTEYDPANDKQHGFLHWMRHNGFRVITKTVTEAADDAKAANLDVEIAVDMMLLARYCNTAVLISGDEDFAYVVSAIASQGVRVEVVGLRSMTSDSLIDAADCYIDLAAIQKTVQKQGGSG